MDRSKIEIYPGVEFIKKLTTEYRKNLSEIVKNLLPEIYDCVKQAGFNVNKTDETLYSLKIKKANDFASIGTLFTLKIFENLNREVDREGKIKKISLANLRHQFLNKRNDPDKEKLLESLDNGNFDSRRIFAITKMILDIKEVRNDLEHEDLENGLSQALLMHSYFNRLMDLIPVHIKEASEAAGELENFLKNSHFKLLETSYDDISLGGRESEKEKAQPIDMKDLEENLKKMVREELSKQTKEFEKHILSKREYGLEKPAILSEDLASPMEFLKDSKNEKTDSEAEYEEYLIKKSRDVYQVQEGKNTLSELGILRKSESETKKELINLGRKIYTLMNNEMIFDWWDCILNSGIIKNIIRHRIFDAEEFKVKKVAPGYLTKIQSKASGTTASRDDHSKKLRDLQIKLFWKDVQEITKRHFYFDYIFNLNKTPWKKAAPVYIDQESKENKKIREEVINYLKINDPKREEKDVFATFSTSYVRQFRKIIDQFPEKKFTWGEIEYQESLPEEPYKTDDIFLGHYIKILKK